MRRYPLCTQTPPRRESCVGSLHCFPPSSSKSTPRIVIHELGIDLVFLPIGSPHLNPIEPVWKSLKWESSPLIVEGAAEYCALFDDIFITLIEQLSFAGSWIENHLSRFIQKLR